ncbi:MAG TPA: hypothetical protein VEK34_03585 [Methylocella sp.]|nr:hypothetical protein [Methylocella sp.]
MGSATQEGATYLKRSMLAFGFLLATMPITAAAQSERNPSDGDIVPVRSEARSDGVFSGLAGHWSGSGVITMSNGAAERIRCRASYIVGSGGSALQQNLRCASQSYQLLINSDVASDGGGMVYGSWAEQTHGVSGNVSGRASGSSIVAHVVGGGFAASFDVRSHGGTLSVSIRPQGGDVAAVAITLHRG